jgi:hypothetical protein
MELIEFMSNNFAYVGRRVGSKAGHYALIGPNWKGKPPADLTEVTPSSPT